MELKSKVNSRILGVKYKFCSVVLRWIKTRLAQEEADFVSMLNVDGVPNNGLQRILYGSLNSSTFTANFLE